MIAARCAARSKREVMARIVPNHSTFRKPNPFDLNSRPFILLLSLPCGEQKRQNPRTMNPQEATIVILVTLFVSLALAEDFKTVSGKIYKEGLNLRNLIPGS
jgi:hypothetical protein